LIVVDTSVLIAIIAQEIDADLYISALEQAAACCIAAPNYFEALLVATGKKSDPNSVRRLVVESGMTVVSWTEAMAELAAQAYIQYGRGRHKAALNFGDCMAYALAKSLDAPLLYKGNDFALTDLRPIARPPHADAPDAGPK